MEQNNKVFIDSNFFIALFNPSDTLHDQAKQIAYHIKHQENFLFISNYTFLEIVTILSQRAGKKRSLDKGTRLLKNPYLIHTHIDEAMQTATWEIFKSISKKNISFVDCSILAVMQYEGIKKLLTFDKQDFSSFRKVYQFTFYSIA